jgi:hypothetical protein
MPTSRPVYVYSGSEWIPIGPQISSVITRWTKTAAGSETSLSGADDSSRTLAYSVGYEQVYLNGVLLVRNSDYTASTGTSITGLTALTINDIVDIIILDVTAVEDTYTQAQSDALYATQTNLTQVEALALLGI